MNDISSLVIALKNNDTRAQNQLISLYWDAVFGFLMNRTQDHHISDELSVQIFSKAITKIQTFQEDKDFGVWLMSIAKHTLIDHYRKNTSDKNQFFTEMEDLPEALGLSPEDMLIADQNMEEILSIISQMDEQYRRIIELRFFDELSIKEIAENLHITESNAKVRLMRAKNILSTLLSEHLR